MCLLVDTELYDLVHGRRPMVRGLPTPSRWYSDTSPIQPASIDLHVGDIFLPEPARPGSDALFALERVALEPGETAVVTTAEILDLPEDIGAFGFPPTEVSKAVLMTNPGHVDPGYKGRLRFTLINMGKERFPIERGQKVVTLLFLWTTQSPRASYAHRKPLDGQQLHADRPSLADMTRLGKDFLDFRGHAMSIAKTAAREEGISLKKWSVLGGFLVLIGSIVGYLWRVQGPINELEEEVAALRVWVQVENIGYRIDSLQTVLDSLMAASTSR